MSARPVKAVVLARGIGSRMRAGSTSADLDRRQNMAADRGAKAMMPLNGRPFLDHSLSVLADAGLTSICLVIGPEHEAIRAHYDGMATRRSRIHYAVQQQARGTSDAVLAAAAFCGQDRFVVVNGDNFYPADALAALVEQAGTATLGFDREALIHHSGIPAERVSAFALLGTQADGELRDVIEKPSPAESAALGPDAPVSMNCWLFGPSFFAAAGRVRPSIRSEYELTDAVRCLLAGGERITVVGVRSACLDLSSRADIGPVAAALADHRVDL